MLRYNFNANVDGMNDLWFTAIKVLTPKWFQYHLFALILST